MHWEKKRNWLYTSRQIRNEKDLWRLNVSRVHVELGIYLLKRVSMAGHASESWRANGEFVFRAIRRSRAWWTRESGWTTGRLPAVVHLVDGIYCIIILVYRNARPCLLPPKTLYRLSIWVNIHISTDFESISYSINYTAPLLISMSFWPLKNPNIKYGSIA